MTVQGNSITLPSGKDSYSAIDTGTTLIGGPQDAIEAIYSNIPNSQPASGDFAGYYTYRESSLFQIRIDIHHFLACSTNVNVTLSFGGRTWDISSTDFAMTTTTNNQCIGSFFILGSSTPAWIIGDTFLVRFCSPFP